MIPIHVSLTLGSTSEVSLANRKILRTALHWISGNYPLSVPTLVGP